MRPWRTRNRRRRAANDLGCLRRKYFRLVIQEARLNVAERERNEPWNLPFEEILNDSYIHEHIYSHTIMTTFDTMERFFTKEK